MDDVKWLVANEIPRLRRYALTLTNDPHAADDLVQDCLERALRKRRQWRRQGSIRGWLYRILYRRFLDGCASDARARGYVPIDEAADYLSAAPRQDERLMYNDIREAMDRLPKDQRAAISLTAVEGFSYDEAAAILGIPVGTLRSRLWRGRERLRHLYGEYQEAPPLRRVK